MTNLHINEPTLAENTLVIQIFSFLVHNCHKTISYVSRYGIHRKTLSPSNRLFGHKASVDQALGLHHQLETRQIRRWRNLNAEYKRNACRRVDEMHGASPATPYHKDSAW